MSQLKNILLLIIAGLLMGIAALLGYLKFGLPNIDVPGDLVVERSPERILRGEYLANNVCVCMDCHGVRDWDYFSAPPKAGSLGTGGEFFGEKFGFPGNYFAPNITSFALGDWTDGEIYRAITSGVNKSGRALFPVMPYLAYGKMDYEDVYSIIAYLRTLPAVESHFPEPESNFPFNFIINTIPKPANPQRIPDTTNLLAYGKYVVESASCVDCHTMRQKGQMVAGMEYAGGMEFPLPKGGLVRSPNITPHTELGIGHWTEDDFVQRFKSSRFLAEGKVEPGAFNSYMPWAMYAGMEDIDLKAMYAYLTSIAPIKNMVVKYKAP